MRVGQTVRDDFVGRVLPTLKRTATTFSYAGRLLGLAQRVVVRLDVLLVHQPHHPRQLPLRQQRLPLQLPLRTRRSSRCTSAGLRLVAPIAHHTRAAGPTTQSRPRSSAAPAWASARSASTARPGTPRSASAVGPRRPLARSPARGRRPSCRTLRWVSRRSHGVGSSPSGEAPRCRCQ